MAAGTVNDFVIYQEQFFGGMTETLQTNTELFNEASRGAMRLITAGKKGDYEQESMVALVSNLVGRRITTSVSAVADTPLTMGEFISVKLNRRIGPAAQTRDAFRKLAQDPELISFIIGKQAGKAVLVDYVDEIINALDAALAGQVALNFDETATADTIKTMQHKVLVSGMALFGDAGQRILAWVMHSKSFYDLMQNTILDKIYEIAGVTIMNGTVASFNKPIVVVDSPQLVIAGTPPKYVTLGLVEGGGVVIESEEREIVSQVVTGAENLLTRIQGEYAFNVGVKGFKWNISGGGANPDDATLGSSANWQKVSTDKRDLAGVRILTL